jgi:hypothetical protein
MPTLPQRALTRATRASLAALALVVSAAACGGDATAPSASPFDQIRKEVVDPAVVAPVLARTKVIHGNRTASAVVDARGGWLSLPEAGLYVYVPAGAVKNRVTLTAKAIPGDLMAYQFGPHGAKFDVPLIMYQSLDLAALPRGTDLSKFEVGYFADERTLDFRTKNVKINEFIPTGIVFDGHAVRFEVSHFSGYVIATGRCGKSCTTTTTTQ